MAIRRYVQYLATASLSVEVEVPDDTDPDEIDSVARDLADVEFGRKANLRFCHHCSKGKDLGEWEQDESKDGVWA